MEIFSHTLWSTLVVECLYKKFHPSFLLSSDFINNTFIETCKLLKKFFVLDTIARMLTLLSHFKTNSSGTQILLVNNTVIADKISVRHLLIQYINSFLSWMLPISCYHLEVSAGITSIHLYTFATQLITLVACRISFPFIIHFKVIQKNIKLTSILRMKIVN